MYAHIYKGCTSIYLESIRLVKRGVRVTLANNNYSLYI